MHTVKPEGFGLLLAIAAIPPSVCSGHAYHLKRRRPRPSTSGTAEPVAASGRQALLPKREACPVRGGVGAGLAFAHHQLHLLLATHALLRDPRVRRQHVALVAALLRRELREVGRRRQARLLPVPLGVCRAARPAETRVAVQCLVVLDAQRVLGRVAARDGQEGRTDGERKDLVLFVLF